MEKSVIVDASFLVALWRKNDQNHPWAIQQARRHPPPWITCESVLSEADHLLAPDGCATLRLACRRRALRISPLHVEAFIPVLDLLEKYADVPMSIADQLGFILPAQPPPEIRNPKPVVETF